MSDFDAAIEIVLIHEGSKFSNLPQDRGGPTKYGVTQKDLAACGLPYSIYDVETLSGSTAKEVYRRLFWEKLGLDQGAFEPVVKTVILDQAVLAGIPTVVDIIQNMLVLKRDGIMGPTTLSVIASRPKDYFCFSFLRAMSRHYSVVCAASPSQLEFFSGWEDRVFDLLRLVFFP